MCFSKCYVLAQAWSGFPRPLLQLDITACGIETVMIADEVIYKRVWLQLDITACGIETVYENFCMLF